MHRFEITIGESWVRNNDAPFEPDRLIYAIPGDALELLRPILGPYGQDPEWYFDNLNFGRPPIPWAIACLDHDYTLGGHVAKARPPNAGITFTQYNPVPNPIPDDFVPNVGVLIFLSKGGLAYSVSRSPLFAAAWSALRSCSPEKRWLVILDPLPQDWLTKALPGDRERWLSVRRKHSPRQRDNTEPHSYSTRELKLTAAIYAKSAGVLESIRTTGKLPMTIHNGGFPTAMRLLIKQRGTDIVLTTDEQIVYNAILSERRLPGGGVILLDEHT